MCSFTTLSPLQRAVKRRVASAGRLQCDRSLRLLVRRQRRASRPAPDSLPPRTTSRSVGEDSSFLDPASTLPAVLAAWLGCPNPRIGRAAAFSPRVARRMLPRMLPRACTAWVCLGAGRAVRTACERPVRSRSGSRPGGALRWLAGRGSSSAHRWGCRWRAFRRSPRRGRRVRAGRVLGWRLRGRRPGSR